MLRHGAENRNNDEGLGAEAPSWKEESFAPKVLVFPKSNAPSGLDLASQPTKIPTVDLQ